jgi:hypothetical protein
MIDYVIKEHNIDLKVHDSELSNYLKTRIDKPPRARRFVEE